MLLKRISTTIFVVIISITLSAQNTSNWFAFNPSGDILTSEIQMTQWIDKPAGKHGFVQMKGDRLVFEDGTPIKFWGTNIASNLPFMEAGEVKKWIPFLTGYGFNSVRFHKFTWHATDGIHSTVLTDQKWKNFDYLCNELRKNGIYYGWSHIYGHKVMKGDSSRVIAYREVANTKFPWSHLSGTTSALVNFAEDLQDLNIELTVNMLNHVNPHTGLRYADDPALSFVEFQNEDDIFWGAIEESLKQAPTYRKLLCKKFSAWLTSKYGNEENLKKAWSNEGLAEGESLSAGNIYPQPNHGLFSWEYNQAIKDNRPVKQHFLDKMNFLYEEQMKFYKKFEKAIRQTGYKGTLAGSCWQAGTGLSHLLNLHTDYEVGIIDRHNYFGGGKGHSLVPGKFDNSAMVSKIGSGLFGTGLQQVNDRPFAFSEWMSLIPTEWTAESAPIIATYGMGLHGWDASYVFATDIPHYSPVIQHPRGGIYNATSPTQLALYPALARMIYRNDITEGKVVVNRNVDLKAMQNGETAFKDVVKQDYDRKSIEGSFPLQLMAAGKVVLTFTGNSRLELAGNIDQLWNDSTVTSNTGELTWSEKGKGYFTINTPGTKGLAGFAKGKQFDLGEISFSTDNEFAVILITSLEPGKPISESRKMLVTAIARARNTDMKYNEDRTELLEVGKAPVLLEPVKLSLTVNGKSAPRCTLLDHTGNKTPGQVKPVKGVLTLDGAATKTMYYLVEF
jgi:hypothetical protein